HLRQGAQAVDRDADVPADVAEPGTLHLHDLRALVAEQRDGVRPRECDRQVDDLDPFEGEGIAHASNSSLLRLRPPGPLYARPYPGVMVNPGSGSVPVAASHESIRRSSAA